jgi:hypothetical protein
VLASDDARPPRVGVSAASTRNDSGPFVYIESIQHIPGYLPFPFFEGGDAFVEAGSLFLSTGNDQHDLKVL